MRRWLLCISVLPALGFQCSKAPPTSPPPAEQPAAKPSPTADDAVPALQVERTAPPGTLAVMSLHFDLAQDLKASVISGEVEAARASAQALANSSIDGLPETWRPLFNDMRVAAEMAAQAPDLDSQARAVAHVAQACGACHGELGAGPGKHLDDIPEQAWPGEQHMPRHMWGTNFMWLGLVSPSEDAFRRGARELSEHAILGKGHMAADLDEAVHQIAAEALVTASDEQARVESMGDLLGSCAACHAATGAVAP